MAIRRSRASIAAMMILAVACGDPPVDPTGLAPNLHRNGDRHRTVVVDPNGRHDATTIQAGIDLAPAGGRVRVRPGTYNERIVINKGLTLEGNEGHDDDDDDGAGARVIIEQVLAAPPTLRGRDAVIQVVTTEPVLIRGITVHHVGLRGLNNHTETSEPSAVDLTIDRMSFKGEFPFPGPVSNTGVNVVNNAAQSGARAHLEIRESRFDIQNTHIDAVGGGLGISLGGDVDALIEHNTARTASACVRVSPAGLIVTVPASTATNVDIVNNEFIDCGQNNATGVNAASDPGFITTGTVNIVGNTFRYTTRTAAPCNNSAITYQFYSGRIEHNSVINAVQSCANPAAPAAAIRVGNAAATPPVRPANVTVRFNDIQGNAFAGLLVRANQTTSLDARCNYWGSASGPSGVGLSGTGDAVVVEAGAARPVLTPFATGPIADGRGHHGHHDDDANDDPDGRGKCHLEFSLWSEPVNLGAVVNSPSNDHAPALSEDQRRLYFSSDRPGGYGGPDIWVSQRDCTTCPWGPPVNLGAAVNSAASEFRPSVRARLLFFQSDRAGGLGATDIWMSRRVDPKNAFGWESPENVGPDVNTPAPEQVPNYVPVGRHGVGSLCFSRGLATVGQDIYCAAVAPDGRTLGPAAFVTELNDPTVNDASPTLRGDGREIIFHSPRAGALGLADLWASTRRHVDDPWSTPVNLGAPPNTAFLENRPFLSADGRTLVFDSNRPGLGAGDLWMSTRTRIGNGRSHAPRH